MQADILKKKRLVSRNTVGNNLSINASENTRNVTFNHDEVDHARKQTGEDDQTIDAHPAMLQPELQAKMTHLVVQTDLPLNIDINSMNSGRPLIPQELL